jgi:hypothetical protein
MASSPAKRGRLIASGGIGSFPYQWRSSRLKQQTDLRTATTVSVRATMPLSTVAPEGNGSTTPKTTSSATPAITRWAALYCDIPTDVGTLEECAMTIRHGVDSALRRRSSLPVGLYVSQHGHAVHNF